MSTTVYEVESVYKSFDNGMFDLELADFFNLDSQAHSNNCQWNISRCYLYRILMISKRFGRECDNFMKFSAGKYYLLGIEVVWNYDVNNEVGIYDGDNNIFANLISGTESRLNSVFCETKDKWYKKLIFWK